MGTVLVENVYALLSIRELLVTAKGLKELTCMDNNRASTFNVIARRSIIFTFIALLFSRLHFIQFSNDFFIITAIFCIRRYILGSNIIWCLGVKY